MISHLPISSFRKPFCSFKRSSPLSCSWSRRRRTSSSPPPLPPPPRPRPPPRHRVPWPRRGRRHRPRLHPPPPRRQGCGRWTRTDGSSCSSKVYLSRAMWGSESRGDHFMFSKAFQGLQSVEVEAGGERSFDVIHLESSKTSCWIGSAITMVHEPWTARKLFPKLIFTTCQFRLDQFTSCSLYRSLQQKSSVNIQ